MKVKLTSFKCWINALCIKSAYWIFIKFLPVGCWPLSQTGISVPQCRKVTGDSGILPPVYTSKRYHTPIRKNTPTSAIQIPSYCLMNVCLTISTGHYNIIIMLLKYWPPLPGVCLSSKMVVRNIITLNWYYLAGNDAKADCRSRSKIRRWIAAASHGNICCY